MQATVHPLPFRLAAELRGMLADASERTGLSQADLVRQAIRRALPQIVRANAKPPGLPPRTLAPLTPAEWKQVNRGMRQDAEGIRFYMKTSAVPSNKELD
jgi:hypothetical protein